MIVKLLKISALYSYLHAYYLSYRFPEYYNRCKCYQIQLFQLKFIIMLHQFTNRKFARLSYINIIQYKLRKIRSCSSIPCHSNSPKMHKTKISDYKDIQAYIGRKESNLIISRHRSKKTHQQYSNQEKLQEIDIPKKLQKIRTNDVQTYKKELKSQQLKKIKSLEDRLDKLRNQKKSIQFNFPSDQDYKQSFANTNPSSLKFRSKQSNSNLKSSGFKSLSPRSSQKRSINDNLVKKYCQQDKIIEQSIKQDLSNSIFSIDVNKSQQDGNRQYTMDLH